MARVSHFLDQLVHLDRLALDAAYSLHWGPATALFVLLSAAWVKGPIIVACGACADVRAQRARPVTAASAAIALAAGAALSGLVKELVDRARPAFVDPAFSALVTTPHTPSFPSGHATTAFAAAAAVGALHPRLRLPLFLLAALVGLSRVYLGVHFALDVVAGAALGTAIGLAVAWMVKRRRWLR